MRHRRIERRAGDGRRIIDAFGGARLANLYGLSETSGGCIISAADDDLDTLVETLGVPIGDFEVRIADDDNRALAPDTDGELQVRGDCVSPGYWNLQHRRRSCPTAGSPPATWRCDARTAA